MASKRKFSYQFKLFLPIVGLLWALIITFTIILHKREISFKTNYLQGRIEIINSRVIDILQHKDDPTQFLQFVNQYFDESVLDNLSLSVYDANTWEKIHSIGFDAPIPVEIQQSVGSHDNTNRTTSGQYVNPDNEHQDFYYNVDFTDDGRYLVQTILPYDEELSSEVSGGSWWWWFMIVAGIVVTIITYLTTRHLSNNIKLLRRFAQNAANDVDFSTIDKFSNDDLGEISRTIVNLYATRKAAIASRELEHRVALKATEDRNKMRSQLTNNINHELKTPATIIQGYLDTIVSNPDMDSDSKQHFIEKARNQAERLTSILNDLSTMTRLEEGSQNVRIEEINFAQYIDEIASDIEESNLIGDMTFIHEDIPDPCLIKGNASLLNGCLMNLIKNSAAYSKGTEMGLKLLSENARFYTFLFWDNGTGVAEEHLPLLFDRFYRVDKGRSRKSGGTGLGLPIAKNSINTIGGTISVRNRATGGLEFIFTLAKYHSKSPTRPMPATPSPASAAPQTTAAPCQSENQK